MECEINENENENIDITKNTLSENFSRHYDDVSFKEWELSCIYIPTNAYWNKEEFVVPVLLTPVLYI